MFQAVRGWFRRNRTYLAVGVGILGAGYWASQYVLGKLNEARQRISDDRIARENLRRRFEQNQEDCTYTVLALLPTATENIMKEIPVEQITQELQIRKSEKLSRSAQSSEIAPSDTVSVGDDDTRGLGGSSFIHASQIAGTADNSAQEQSSLEEHVSKKTKVQLWDELKIASITRAFTLIYTLCLLTMFTRIQLNLLGRRNYLSSVVSLASPSQDSSKISLENRDDDNLDQDYGSDFETNRKYLTFSWWLLHRGWKEIVTKVEGAVNEVFGGLTPRENITFETFSKLTLDVRMKVEGASPEERRSNKWLTYLLPPRAEEEAVLRESSLGQVDNSSHVQIEQSDFSISPSLRRLLDETSDLVDSPTFTHVITLALDATFSFLVDNKIATQAFKLNAPYSQSEPRVQDVTEGYNDKNTQTTKLAAILASMTRQALVIGSGGNINPVGSSSVHFSDDTGTLNTSPRTANQYLATLESVRDLEAFAAVIYSSNFEYDGLETEILTNPALDGATNSNDGANLVSTDYDSSPVVRNHETVNFESAWGKATER